MVSFEQLRLALGLGQEDVAARIGLTPHEYDDVECEYADGATPDFIDKIDTATARRICEVLGCDFLDAVSEKAGIAIAFRGLLSATDFYGRRLLISERMTALAMSAETLADAIDFEPHVIAQVLRSPAFLDSLPPSVLIDLAHALAIDPGRLLAPPQQD